ncbi:hypothetical protein ACFWHT_10875 [Microbacterium sp. NPDC058342]|uniref:hypothetical protein n=1 Tax=Microbacterium sp. NPDC058342 TaxID=3346454 RepID=UPI00364CA93B
MAHRTAHRNVRRRFSIVSALAGLATALFVAAPAPAFAAPAAVEPVPLTTAHAASSVYSLSVNGVSVPVNGYSGYDCAEFTMGAGEARIAVTKLNGTNVGATYITPIKAGYVASHAGSTSTFTIAGPQYLIVKLDGNRRLIISAEREESNIPAVSGPGIFPITAYGAVPDDAGADTTAGQQAIDAASAYGSAPGNPRGVVRIPFGAYQVANLELRSNIEVYFVRGAVLRLIPDRSLYSIDAHKSSQNRDLTWWIQTEFGSENITLRGHGTLDGRGQAAVAAGFGMNILAPIATTNFRVEGLTVREAASWAVIPVRSDHLEFLNMKLFNRLDMGENDGIDVIESQNVLVRDGVGIGLDDPYTTKSWPKNVGITKNWPGDPEDVRDVRFDRLISWTYCYGFKVGQGVVNDHSNIRFTNSVVHDASVGIGIHHKSGAGTADDVGFYNIDIERLTTSNDGNRTWLLLKIDDAYGDGAGPITNTLIRSINVRSAGTTPAVMKGFSAASSVQNVLFDKIRMPGASGYATTLADLNITSPSFATGITIQP